MVEIVRTPTYGNTETDSVRLFVKRESQRKDKDGIVYRGDLPNDYFNRTPAYFNKDSTLANKDAADLHYGYQHRLIQNRLIRESIPDEEYGIEDLIEEFDLEYAAENLDTMNKRGRNRELFVTTVSESTGTSIVKEDTQKKGWGLFNRK